MVKLFWVVVLLFISGHVESFHLASSLKRRGQFPSMQLKSSSISKQAFISVAAISLALNFGISANAGDDTTSKKAKGFELCLSKCIFNETKPPPIGSDTERLENTRSRTEILKTCKTKCATSKEQLMIGVPKAPKSSPSP